jgi:hypothetical protein
MRMLGMLSRHLPLAGWYLTERHVLQGVLEIFCGRALPLDGAFHRAEVAGTTRFGGGDESGGG